MRLHAIRPEFVEFIPDDLQDGVLYISERFKTCSHKCCCGCGEEVVTPLSPAEWTLNRVGESVSLWPSVGNWDYACRSHYFIRENRVRWAGSMTAKQIARVRQRDEADLERLLAVSNARKLASEPPDDLQANGYSTTSAAVRPAHRNEGPKSTTKARPGLLARLWFGLFGRRDVDERRSTNNEP